jgi:transcriptional regulator with XRE-family HTH domain
MADTTLLIDVLKRELKAHGKTYAELATALAVSESSVKRMFSQKEMSLSRLDDICRFLHTDFATLSRAALELAPGLSELSYAQEAAVVKDPLLLLVAICVLSHWRFEEVVEVYAITEAQCVARFAALDKLGVIELKPLNRYRLKVAKTFRWLPDGPIRQYFMQHIVGEYFGGRFDRAGETLLMVHGNFGKASAIEFAERLTRLGQDFAAQHLTDQKLSEEHREGHTLIVGLRHWEFSGIGQFRRQKPL